MRYTFTLPLIALLGLTACSKSLPRPTVTKTVKSGDAGGQGAGQEDGSTNPNSPTDPVKDGDTTPKDNRPDPVIVDPADAQLKSSISLSDSALALGPKAPACKDQQTSKGKSLGAYINFEVVEAATKVSFSLKAFCGDVAKKNVLAIYDSTGQNLIKSVDLPSQALTKSTTVLNGFTLEKGRYMLAIEVAGTKLSELSSIQIEGGELSADKKIRFESVSEY